jgi:hypothetical protein
MDGADTASRPYGNLLESFTTLSYLAARTQRIGLGTGILVLPQRDPLLAAKQAATVHHLSSTAPASITLTSFSHPSHHHACLSSWAAPAARR